MLFKKALTILLLMTMIFAAGTATYGQSAPSNGERIRQLREEIAKREAADVPTDLVDLNRSKLIERRAELRTVLKVEMDNLRKHRVLLGSFISQEESQKIDDALQSYATEIDRLRNSIQKDLAAEGGDRKSSDASAQAAAAEPKVDKATSDTGARSSSQALAGPASTSNNGTITPSRASAANPFGKPGPSVTKLDVMPDDSAAPQKGSSDIDCQKQKQDEDAGKDPSNQLNVIVCGLVRDIVERRASGSAAKLDLGTTQPFELIKILIAKQSTPKYLVEAEETRLDKQVGSAPGSAGTTSLVVKGGAPMILGFAVENGGLTKSTSGSAITFRGNPVGLINALSNRGFVPSVKQDENDPLLRFLKKTSFAFTFDTNRGPEPGVLTATKQQLSSFSTRLELINNRRPKLYIKDWEHFLGTRAQQLANVINQNLFVDASDPANPKWSDPALQAWFVQTQAALATATDAEVSAVLQARLDKLPVKNLLPTTVTQLETIEHELGLYMSGRDDLLKKINSGTVVTLEYQNKREVTAPDTSTFSFIAEKGLRTGKIDFTFNGSVTMFNNMGALRNFIKLNPTLPPARRLRDFQFAGQIDVPVGSVSDFGQFVLFASGRYERLLENASTDIGTVLPNTKGDIAYLQAGIKVPIKGTGFKIPFSITFANRSELVKERSVRGNIGFTLDLDTLFAKLKPF